MKIFLSWSGVHSRAVAEALNDWLRRVIQAVKPFYSAEIEKGAKWSSEIDNALEGTHFGIICLTPDNLKSTWIHFETGALSKTKDAMIWTFLHGLTPGDVPQPLGKFQHTVAKKDDTLRLIKTINRRLGEIGGESLAEKLLEENFETFWPQLESRLTALEKQSQKPPHKSETLVSMPRDERAIMNEILELVRNQERRLNGIESYVLSQVAEVPTKEDATPLCRSVQIRIPTIEEDPIDYTEIIARELSKASSQSVIKRIPGDDSYYVVEARLNPPITRHTLDRILAICTPPGARFLVSRK